MSQGTGTVQTLKPGDVDAIAQQCPAVAIVVPMVWARAQAIYGKRNWSPGQLNGTAPEYLATRDWEDLEEGTCFNDEDVRACRAVCLVGTTIKRELFEDESPLEQDDPPPQRPLPGHRGLEPQGRELDGPGPGRLHPRPLDDDQVPPQQRRRRVVANRGGRNHRHGQYPEQHRTSRPRRSIPRPWPCSRPTRPSRCGMSSIDFIQAKAASAEQVPVAIDQIAALLRERHHRAEGQETISGSST